LAPSSRAGIFHFTKFGADSYVVDMVGILVLRELGVLIVAICGRGRSAAPTAELGSMKMREEIGALSTMGLDPIEVLMLPRIIADLCAADLTLSVRWQHFMAAALSPGSMAVWGRQSSLHGCMRPCPSPISKSVSSRRRSWRW
jgi:phospholipid/cholesterol/gamma-HCH transport system permease protein